MHSILVLMVYITFLVYLISYVISSLSVVVRKFWKKIKFTNFETAWLIFFIGVFFPPPSSSMNGIVEFAVLLTFIIINFFWFIPLVHYYESRIRSQVTPYLFGSVIIMSILSGIILGGWYDIFFEDLWMPLSDVIRLLIMGFSLLYCGYLVNNSDTRSSQPKRFEYYSLMCIGLSSFVHGLYHILVYRFDIFHNFEEISAAPESLEIYLVIVAESFVFGIGAIGFIVLLINTVKNSDYRPVPEYNDVGMSSQSS